MATTIIDFFAGAGGSSLGCVWAGARPIAAINHWHVAAATLRANHPGLDVREEDVTSIHDLPPADGLLFSPECTWHSHAQGARRWAPEHQAVAERSRTTAWQVSRWIRALKPSWFVVENVPDFCRWPRFDEWRAELATLGYFVTHGILDASRFGVPQARRRWFCVGSRDQLVTLPTGGGPVRTARECIDWSIPATPIRDRKRPLCARTMGRIQAGQDAGLQEFLVSYYGQGNNVFSLDRPCRTVTTKARFGLVVGDGFRMLEPLEYRRIMGFPDSYYLAGNRAQQIHQLGNAVPPPLMQAIVQQFAA